MSEKTNPVGRPLLDWKEEEVKIFGRFRATHGTMADYYGVSVRTIDRLMEPEQEFCQIYKKSLSTTKMTLHETQLKVAIEEQNPTVLIWMGKQLLGQRDKQDVDHTSNGETLRPQIIFQEK